VVFHTAEHQPERICIAVESRRQFSCIRRYVSEPCRSLRKAHDLRVGIDPRIQPAEKLQEESSAIDDRGIALFHAEDSRLRECPSLNTAEIFTASAHDRLIIASRRRTGCDQIEKMGPETRAEDCIAKNIRRLVVHDYAGFVVELPRGP
jgi:hypothetical protein